MNKADLTGWLDFKFRKVKINIHLLLLLNIFLHQIFVLLESSLDISCQNVGGGDIKPIFEASENYRFFSSIFFPRKACANFKTGKRLIYRRLT